MKKKIAFGSFSTFSLKYKVKDKICENSVDELIQI